MRNVVLLYFMFMTSVAFSQKEAANWYFHEYCGLNFTTGVPVAQTNGKLMPLPAAYGCPASISDSNGSLLFYTNGRTIWNRKHEIMQNGDGLNGDSHASQSALILPLPGSSTKYYIFTIGSTFINRPGLHFHIVDMNSGDGEVILKNQAVSAGINARTKLTAVKTIDGAGYWIITRIFDDNHYASFNFDQNGLNPNPFLSETRYRAMHNGLTNTHGVIKISHDKKKAFIVYKEDGSNHDGELEICSFNDTIGKLEYLYTIKEFMENQMSYAISGIEASPDSKILYVNFFNQTTDDTSTLYQYDLTKYKDSLAFLNSHTYIGTTRYGSLQLAIDGKIYGSSVNEQTQEEYYYIDVINNVWEKGHACDFQRNIVDLADKMNFGDLPNISQDFLYRFVWIGSCAKAPINFRHRFIPEPESILWNFGDGATSTDLNPLHIYQNLGIYEVHAHVVYPNGRIEETSREVTVLAAPEPELGNDIQKCDGVSTQLNAGIEPGAYSWSTGAWGPNLNSITVADTGTYWVRVRNNAGCYGSDTISVTMFPKPILDTTNLVISPTTCGGSTGAIRGLTVAGTNPINVEWRDVDGNVLETGYDIFDLPVNNYYFYATDGNGCTTLLDHFQIKDAGDILIDTVVFQPSYCGLNNGSIIITAVNGLGDMLDYSINNGTNYVHNQSEFNNLTPNSYNIKVTDSSGCQAVWPETIIIQNLAGPEVSPGSTPATGSNADGTVTLNATGFGILTYSLENITQSDSLFTGLAAGIYHYRVEDENGCFTEGDIEVESISGITLTAIAGNGQACMGTSVRVPVKVKNFTGVKAFSATLNYDPTKLSCLGPYPGSIHNLLSTLNFIDYPSLGRIVATWDSAASVSIQDTALLFELVFKSTNPGSSFVTWDQAPLMTWFSGDYGNIDDIEFTIGQVLSVNPPAIMQEDPKVCEGDLLWVSALATGTEPFNYEWILPNGQPYNSSFYVVLAAKQTDAGKYTVKVTDPIGCSDTAVFNVTVIPPPSANFPEEPIPFENQYTLEAPQGYFSYEWSNGATNYFITVTEEGEYSVIIKATEGCESIDTAMLVNVAVPVYVPNAFTPNGDGLNDTFKPIIIKPDLISQYHLSIYNRWGQCFFETSDPAKGWDGKDEVPGVYNWVVSYMDGMGKVNQLRGVVTLIK